MQRLCSLMLILIPFTGFAQLEFDLAMTQSDFIGSANVRSTRAAERTSTLQSLVITGPQLGNGFRFSGSMIQAKNDYSAYILQAEDGSESVLSSSFDEPETSGSVNATFTSSRYTLSADRNQTLSSSPLKSAVNSFTAGMSFNEQLTHVRIQHGFGQLTQPKTYFTDLRTAQRRVRPEQIQIQSSAISLDHVLTERIKIRTLIDFNEKSDRPSSLGYQLGAALAIDSKNFLRSDFAYASENQMQALKDERGYFDLLSAEFTYSRYINYDWIISASYALVVEKENNPQALRHDRMASDLYSLRSTYDSGRWSAGVNLQQLLSNVEYQSASYGGHFSWSY